MTVLMLLGLSVLALGQYALLDKRIHYR